MANKVRGQRSFQVEGKEYIVHFDMNAIAELEDALDMSIAEISEVMQEPKKIRVRFMITLLWAGLKKHHNLTPEEAEEIYNKGNVLEILNAVGEAYASSMMTEEQWKQAEQMIKEQQKKMAIQAQKKRSGTGRR